MSASISLRRLATSTTLAAFAAASQAGTILDDNGALVTARNEVSIALAKATGSDAARIRSGAFMTQLEAALAGRQPSAQTYYKLNPQTGIGILGYPNTSVKSELVVGAVIPSKSQNEPIRICAQKDGEVKAAFYLHESGQLTSAPIAAYDPNGTGQACMPTLISSYRELAAKLAQAPAQGGKVAAATATPTLR